VSRTRDTFIFIPGSATRDGRDYSGYATAEQAAAIGRMHPDIVVEGDDDGDPDW